ncbi:hypothetical protein [Bradyrhizobium sp. DOA1]|uniref:hypothetical protein n=1 Tax=Bradyrhizobium sp. DOA1 TaxID=1126616 RepID=UPI00077C47C4|nr:hypothetical protein [Bradyrhizobium sp. DOA1]KYH01708.1 hypothetical protein SE91_27365 [Bradyrhizobium sp. DOA1]
MRELLKIMAVGVAILAGWFAYVWWFKPNAFATPVRELALMGVLEDYRSQKGTYPVLKETDVSVAELVQMLAHSGFTVRPDRLKLNPQDRYVSVTGESYGLLYNFSRSGQLETCIVEMRAVRTGWWGQPPPCPW